MAFQRAAQAALIHDLQVEVTGHQSRLQRALDGKSPVFVPTGNERISIAKEFRRLLEIQAGVALLGAIWAVAPKPKQHYLSPKALYVVLTHAIERLTDVQLSHADMVAVDQLIKYLGAKRACGCLDHGAAHIYQYDTHGQDFGYALRRCASD